MTVIVIARLIEASLKNSAGENYPTNIGLNGSYNDDSITAMTIKLYS